MICVSAIATIPTMKMSRKLSQPLRSILRTFTKSYQNTAAVIPELTENRYNMKRGNYSAVNDIHITFFEKLIGSSHVLTNSDEITSYNIDFLKSVRGNSKVVLLPRSTEAISELLKYCNNNNLAVCPQGGNTGLVGGSVPVFDEIILSLSNLNKIESIDEITGILVCQSGCVLESIENYAMEHNLVVPIDLGAKGSCHIGGNISTNAGGLRVLRYGNLHGSVLGLEAVLANGTILNLMSKFRKDNTGYHLKHMFIGSEGTLGVVTRVAIYCPPAPNSVHVAFLGIPSFEGVLKTFLRAKKSLGEVLSSCEMIDAAALKTCINVYNLQSPVEGYPFYMLIEASGSDSNHDEEKMYRFLELGLESGEIGNGTISGDPKKIKDIWQLRELIPTGLMKAGYCFKYDISVPLQQFYDIVLSTRERVGDLAYNVCGYGHLGDSNLHLNVSCKEFNEELYEKLEPFVFEYTSKLGGSISAEHGIGFLKSKYLKYSKSREAISAMKELKQLFDPKNILNPYKVIC